MPKLIAFIFFIHLARMGYSQSGFIPMKDTLSFKAGLEEFSRSTFSIQSEFVQEKKLKMLKDKVVSKGQLYFKKEDKLRWEYREPYSYIIALNKGSVMLKDEGKVSRYDAASNKLFVELNEILIMCVNGNIFQNRKFIFRFFESGDYNIVELSSQSPAMKNFIERIYLSFDKSDFTVSRVEMMEPSGNSTLILFKNKKRNAEIPDAYFILQ